MNALRRLLTSLVIVLGSGVVALAQANADASRAQVEAATATALASLRADVAAARMTPAFTVGQYLQAIGAPDALDEIVRDARQIGGPRWIDDQTCQVKLELTGASVAYDLIAWAGTRRNITPIPAAALEQQLTDMKQRVFTATGTSVSGERVAGLRPIGAGDRWNAVSDTARTQAVDAARQDAVRHAMDSIRGVSFGPNQTVGDLLARQDVQQNVDRWLSARPVTEVRFREDLQVELTVSTPPDDLLQAVIESARQVPGAQVPTDEQALADLRREFAKRVSAIGRASVTPGGNGGAPRAEAIQLPDQPPAWAEQSIDAEAIAPAGKNSLIARTHAQDQASTNLRARIGALPLSRTMTLDQAASKDPRVALAINRAMLRARVTRTDWKQPGGAVLVAMTLDPWVVWSELRQASGQ
jgi:hypothetical protein